MTADDLALESAAEPVTEAAETADAAQTVEAAPTDEAIDETAEAAAEDATETAPPEDEPLAALPEDAAERMVEALLFASASPLSDEDIAGRLPGAADVPVIMARLCERYAGRGVEVCKVADRWTLRTAPDLGFLLETEKVEQRKLSRAALETLAIIAYHQPATRAEIEEVRGVAVSKGTLDLLLEIGWIKIAGRRRAPGKPVTYATSDGFLEHFGLESVEHLPGLDELKAAGLLDGRLPPDFSVPAPKDAPDADLGADAEDGEEPPDFASDFFEGEADDAG